MFRYFFLAKENVPSDMGFEFYDGYHLSWLCLISLFVIVISIGYKKTKLKDRHTFRKIYGTVVLLTEVYYQLVLLITGQYNVNYLPFHLCGLAIFLCFYDCFKPNDVIREFLYCLCMPGALMALLFPNWSDCPIFNFSSINSFIVHGLLVAYPVMLINAKEFSPDYKKLPKCGCLLTAIACPMYFFNKIFDTNFLFINTPSEGSPLVALEDWLGNPGYIFGMMFMVMLCWFVLYIPVVIKNLHIKDDIENQDLLEV